MDFQKNSSSINVMANKIYNTKIHNIIFKEFKNSMWAFRNKIKDKTVGDLEINNFNRKNKP